MITSGPTPLAGDMEGERDVMEISCRSSLRREGFEPNIGHSSPRVQNQDLSWFETSGTYQRAVRNGDSSHEEHAYTLAYSQEESEGSQLKIPWDYGWFPKTTPALTGKLP